MSQVQISDEACLLLKGRQTIFGDVFERKVVFCIDTSGSMFELLNTVKESLIETLLKMAYREGESEFNLISFSSTVQQWSDSLVKCNPGTAGLASKWIQELQPSTGTNTLDALLCAFRNNCDAVFLVTDGLPDQETDVILDHIAYIGKGRPVHCIYIHKGEPDRGACDFLKALAEETFGSFNMVAFARHGCIERVTPIYSGVRYTERIIRTNDGTIYPNLSNCSVTTRLNGDPLQDPVFTAPGVVTNPVTGAVHPYFHPHNHWFWWGLPVPGAYGPYMYNPYYSWSRYRASRAYIRGQQKLADAETDSTLCPTSSALLIGRKVLARRSFDGFYHSGTVKSQTASHRFIVQFGPIGGKDDLKTEYEDLSVVDIIGFDDAFRHPLLPGDRCLVPTETSKPLRYQPATLMEGSERRAGHVPEDDQPITVSLFTGTIITVPAGLALWIPNAMFHRLSLESKMPKKAREKLTTKPGYPHFSEPGYPVDIDNRYPKDYTVVRPLLEEGRSIQVDHLLPPYYLPVHPAFEIVGTADEEQEKHLRKMKTQGIVPGTNLTCDELNEKVCAQINAHNTTQEKKEEKGEEKEEAAEKEEKAASRTVASVMSDCADSGYGGAAIDNYNETPDSISLSSDNQSAISKRLPLVGKPRQPWRNFSKGSIPSMLDPPDREPDRTSKSPITMETRTKGQASEMPQYDRQILLSELSGSAASAQAPRSAWQPSGPLGDVSRQVGLHELGREQRDLERTQFRRERMLQREELRQSRMAEMEQAVIASEEQARQRRSAQLTRLQERQERDEAQLQRQREYKRHLINVIRETRGDPDAEKAERDVRRVQMMRERQEERESLLKERAAAMEENRKRLELMRFQRDDARWREVHDRLAAEEAACRRQDLVMRGTERERIAEWRRQEERSQKMRDMEAFARRQNEPPLA